MSRTGGGSHGVERSRWRRPGDVAASFAGPALAAAELGWKARLDLEAMCRDAWRWQSRNPKGYP